MIKHRSSTRVGLSLLLAALVASLAGQASAKPARTGINHRSAIFGRVNPVGLLLESETSWRWAMAPTSGSLIEGAHLDAGLALTLSPVHIGYGFVLEAEPAEFLVLRARALRLHYLGTYGSVHELGSLDADWSPERLAAIADAGGGHAADGYLVEGGAQLRLAVGMPGPLLLADVRWSWSSVQATSPFYEPYSGLLLAPEDVVTVTWALLGWRFSPWLLMGARWELDVGEAAAQPRHTLAGAVQWTLKNEPRELTFAAFGVVGIYLDDPHRTSEAYLAIGLSIEVGVGADSLVPPWVPGMRARP